MLAGAQMNRLWAIFCIILFISWSSTGSATQAFEQKLEEAQNLYYKLQISESRGVFEDLLAKLPHQYAFTPIRFNALLGLALIEQVSNNPSRTKVLLRDAIRLAGWQSLNQDKYPPSFISLYQQLKREEIREMGAIAITTDPPFADLTVQGFKVGQSPLTLEFLPKGLYSIEARLSGYISATDSVEIHDKSQRIVSLSLLRPKQSKDAKTGLPYLRDNEILASIPSKKSKDHWYEKPWVWGSGLLVGGGVLVFFLARDSKDGGISINLP